MSIGKINVCLCSKTILSGPKVKKNASDNGFSQNSFVWRTTGKLFSCQNHYHSLF